MQDDITLPPLPVDAAPGRCLNRPMARSRRHRRSPWLRALVGVAVAGILLGMGEISLRLAGFHSAYRVEDLGRWRFSAHLTQEPTQGPRDGHSFLVTTNGDGLRTSLTRGPGNKPRIALMGDSTVFGWGVDDGSTLADGIQQHLPESEVLNAGQPGYSTTMMAWLFGEVIAAYQPTWTLVFVPMHDSNLVLVSDQEVLFGGASWVDRSRVWLARESRLYGVLRKLLFPLAGQAWLLPDQHTAEPRVPRVSDAERSRVLDAMREKMEEWGGHLAIGYLPFKGDIEDGAPSERPTSAWARDYGQRNQVPILELQRCCIGEEGLVLPDDPGHLSVKGNLRVGGVVAEELRRRMSP